MAKPKIIRIFDAPKTAGRGRRIVYDNQRENIDPRIISKSVNAVEYSGANFYGGVFYGDGSNLTGVSKEDYWDRNAARTMIYPQNIGDTISGANLVADKSLTVSGSNFVVQEKGYVGIGTTGPGAKFHISAAGGLNPNFIMSGNGEQTFRFYNSNPSGTTRVSWKMASRINTDWTWIMYTDYTENGSNNWLIQNNVAGVVLYANSNGNVGIRTTSPKTPLDVNGAISGANLFLHSLESADPHLSGAVFISGGCLIAISRG